MLRTIVFLAYLLVFSAAAQVVSVHAQTTENASSTPSAVSVEDLDRLYDKLNADEKGVLLQLVRMLSEDPAAEAAQPADKPSFGEIVSAGWRDYSAFLVRNITGFTDMFSGSFEALRIAFFGRSASDNMTFLLFFAVMLAVGAAAEFLVTRWIRTRNPKPADTDADNLVSAMRVMGMRLGRELAGLAAFVVASLIAARFLFGDPGDRLVAASFVYLPILVTRMTATVLRFMLAPGDAAHRLVTTDDWTAGFIYRNLTILTGIVSVGLFISTQLQVNGLTGGEPLRFWLGLFVYLGIVYVTWRGRAGLTAILKGDDEHITPGLERMASWWPPVSIVLILVEYFAVQIARSTGIFDIPASAAVVVLALIVLAPFFDTVMRGLVRHLMPPIDGEGPIAEAAYQQTHMSYVRIGRVVLAAIFILLIGRLWGISARTFAEDGPGAQLIGALMILLVGYLVWEVANLWINRKLAKDISGDGSDAPESGEGYGAGQSRLSSVLPLVKMTLQVAIVTITILLALGQLGVNITPLLAGAGVLGLAIGFGAQTLVKDVVSGVFFLLDDAFRVGEFIDVGGTVGTVEKISVRSLQLRHPNGPVHIVPYGEIPKLTNNSRDYVIVKLRFTVPFDTDLDKVRKIFKKIGQQLMENPAHAENMLQPFKSQGVAEVDDVGIVVRGKFMSKPGTQWIIRKEIYNKVQRAFDENGIQFARKEVRVQLPGMEQADLTEEQTQAVAAAASAAAEKPPTPAG